LPRAQRRDPRVFFDSDSSVLLAGKKVLTSDVTAGSCFDQISLSADYSAGITASSYLDGGDLLVDLRFLVAGACVERLEKEAGRGATGRRRRREERGRRKGV
jgi:hypothetical protein